MDERTRKKIDAVTRDGWEGWHVTDQPWVLKNPSNGKERSVDQMLSELDKRLQKNGKIEEYQERQYYTPPSEERRQEKERVEYMLDSLPDRANNS